MWILISLTVVSYASIIDNSVAKRMEVSGEIILGGLFPMHEAGTVTTQTNRLRQIDSGVKRNLSGMYMIDSSCGRLKEGRGIQRLEAMLYAVDCINNDTSLLPNVTLGFFILDTCSRDTYALEQSMEFVKSSLSSMGNAESSKLQYKCPDGAIPEYQPVKPVSGVIGASSSSVSVMVANILRLFKIPQISYASTSTELSDKSRFGYFSRVVPPDNFQAQAMVEIVKMLGWNYVSTVAAEGEYGEKGIESFKRLAIKSGLCIAVSEKIARNSVRKDFDRIISSLSSKPMARGVVVFIDEDDCRKLLKSSLRNKKDGHFMWVGSDNWGAKIYPVKGQEIAAEGAITILPKKVSLTGFDTYFKALNPRSNKRNIWFKEYWEQKFNCSFKLSALARQLCTGDEIIRHHEQEGLVPFVVDAVYAIAHALHRLIQDYCGEETWRTGELCDILQPAPPGATLLQYIRNISFISMQGRYVNFNDDGDASGSYNIYQYQVRENGNFDYVPVGEWTESLRMDLGKLKWAETDMMNQTWKSSLYNNPKSVCSAPCPVAHIRNFLGEKCCWNCFPCRNDEFITNDTCTTCPAGYVPNLPEKLGCLQLPVEYMQWDSAWSIVPYVFAIAGIMCTMFVAIVFFRFNNTPVIMASGRELCYVLLFGIFSNYFMTFVILAKPTSAMCTLLRVGIGLCLSVCYAAIFTKTNRISRIFNRGVRSTKRPQYTSPQSQIVICFGIVSVQLIGILAWLIVEPPSVKEVYPNKRQTVLQCGISQISLIISLLYNMLLIVLCTTYAFKTRKIPENFNEAKYIGFTMYSTCIVWLAFVPIYFGTNNDFKIQTASLCMCISISATVALGCLFVPKVYIVLCQPYKNVRQSSCSQGSASGCTGRTLFSHSTKYSRRTASSAAAAMVAAAVIPVSSSQQTEFTTNGELTSPSMDESSMD